MRINLAFGDLALRIFQRSQIKPIGTRIAINNSTQMKKYAEMIMTAMIAIRLMMRRRMDMNIYDL